MDYYAELPYFAQIQANWRSAIANLLSLSAILPPGWTKPMSIKTLDWRSFWDLASPEEAARALCEFYGAEAAEAALSCAIAARNDSRESDFRFWMAVYDDVKDTVPIVKTTPTPFPH